MQKEKQKTKESSKGVTKEQAGAQLDGELEKEFFNLIELTATGPIFTNRQRVILAKRLANRENQLDSETRCKTWVKGEYREQVGDGKEEVIKIDRILNVGQTPTILTIARALGLTSKDDPDIDQATVIGRLNIETRRVPSKFWDLGDYAIYLQMKRIDEEHAKILEETDG